MKYNGILFDLDGTLWDACRSVAESWRQTLVNRFGASQVPSLSDIQSIMGMTGSQIGHTLFSNIGEDPVLVYEACAKDECDYLAIHGGTIYPGVEELLRTLSGRCPLFLVSNCQEGYIEAFFRYTGFGIYFTDCECEGHTKKSKSDNICDVIERNKISAPVYIGDTEMDKSSAILAGCPFIHAAYGFGAAQHPAAVINTPLELIKVLELDK